jgi:hypothetical protein
MKGLILYTLLTCSMNTFSQTMDWVSLPQEVNDFVFTMCEYDGKLIAGGWFTQAGSTPVNRIAAWDGSSWTSLGNGVTMTGITAHVQEMIVYQNELYISGGFDTAGVVPAHFIAKWDGSAWSSVGSGPNASNLIYAMEVYNNELYVAGTFDSINGIPATHIAKFDGINWSNVSTGIHGSNVNDLHVYKDELYAVGVFDSAGYVHSNYITKWNGIQWDSLDYGVPYGNSAMIEWNNELLVGSDVDVIMGQPYFYIHSWDSIQWNNFSNQEYVADVIGFETYNNQLYLHGRGSVTGPVGYSYVANWDGNNWNNVGTGLNKNVEDLIVYNGELYACGWFDQTNYGSYHNYIAKLGDVTGIEETTLEKKTIIKIIDLMGRETIEKPNTILIYVYSDGSTEKVYKVE